MKVSVESIRAENNEQNFELTKASGYIESSSLKVLRISAGLRIRPGLNGTTRKVPARLETARKEMVRKRPLRMIRVHTFTNDYHVPLNRVLIEVFLLSHPTIGQNWKIKTEQNSQTECRTTVHRSPGFHADISRSSNDIEAVIKQKHIYKLMIEKHYRETSNWSEKRPYLLIIFWKTGLFNIYSPRDLYYGKKSTNSLLRGTSRSKFIQKNTFGECMHVNHETSST